MPPNQQGLPVKALSRERPAGAAPVSTKWIAVIQAGTSTNEPTVWGAAVKCCTSVLMLDSSALLNSSPSSGVPQGPQHLAIALAGDKGLGKDSRYPSRHAAEQGSTCHTLETHVWRKLWLCCQWGGQATGRDPVRKELSVAFMKQWILISFLRTWKRNYNKKPKKRAQLPRRDTSGPKDSKPVLSVDSPLSGRLIIHWSGQKLLPIFFSNCLSFQSLTGTDVTVRP